jgi:hypothetical protein
MSTVEREEGGRCRCSDVFEIEDGGGRGGAGGCGSEERRGEERGSVDGVGIGASSNQARRKKTEFVIFRWTVRRKQTGLVHRPRKPALSLRY